MRTGVVVTDKLTGATPAAYLVQVENRNSGKALDLLGAKPNGFFLLVEGSRIDHASHHNLTEEAIGETIAFDKAVGAALEYARKRDDTLVIVTADHETGGFAITGGSSDGAQVEHCWFSPDHTGEMVPVYAYDPGVEQFSGTYHLTEIAHKIAGLMGISSFPQLLEKESPAEGYQPTARPKHVAFLIVDGFDPLYFDYGLPNFERVAREGVWVKQAKTIMPAATTAGMTSLITGNYPKTHGVPNNIYYDRNLDIRRESPRVYTVPNIGELFQEKGLKTVSVNHFMMESRGSDIHVSGGWNTLSSYFYSELPELVVFIDQTPDSVGHKRGAKSKEMVGTMKQSDYNLGDFLKTLEDLNISEDTLIVIAADHGMAHIEDDKRVGEQFKAALESTGLKVEYLSTNTKFAEDTDILWYSMVTGAGIIYRRPLTAEEEETLINQLTGVPGVDSIWSQEKISEEGMHPDAADLWVNLAPGYGLAAADMGGHASIYQQAVPLIMRGPGVKSGVVLDGPTNIRTVDLVPTILCLIGMDIPETIEGRVLNEILEVEK